MRKRLRRTAIIISVVLCMVFALSGCGGTEAKGEAPAVWSTYNTEKVLKNTGRPSGAGGER